MSTQERDRRRARLEQLSDLDLTLMAGDYLASLEEHIAAKDWQSAESLRPDLNLIDEILKERGLYDGRNEGERKRREALLEEVAAARARRATEGGPLVAGQILKRGERNFIVRVFLGRDANGKRDYHNQTVRGSKKDAQVVLSKLLRDKDMGTLLEPSRESPGEYLDRWLEAAAKPRLGASSYGDYERLLRYYVRPELGATLLQKLTALDIQKVYVGMQARDLSPRTVQYTHRVLRNTLEQAVKWRVLIHNPAQYAELPRQERRETCFMTDEESRRFLTAARSSQHYAFFTLMLSTGLRPSEALALRWQDVDLKRHALRITRTVKRIKGVWLFEGTKNKRNRVVDYPVSLNEVLLAHRARQAELVGESALVFSSLEGTPLHEKNMLTRYYRPLLSAAGLPKEMRLYDLRHTHASLLLLAGVHPKVVSERLGHSSVVITLDTYSHVIPSLQRESADKLDAVLFGDLGETRATALN